MKPLSNYVNEDTASMKQYYHQKVLASFLTKIPCDNGWWYRLPEETKEDKIKSRNPTDTYLPHFGAIFGLTEESTLIILVEMGLIKLVDNDISKINRQGWDNLKALFGVEQYLELPSVTQWKEDKQFFCKSWYVCPSPIKNMETKNDAATQTCHTQNQ